MKKIHIKSNFVIGILTIMSIVSFLIVEHTMKYVKQDYFNEKIKATQITKNAIQFLKDYRSENILFIDNINDPNETGIIGQKYTQITSETGSLTLKLSATNPNFAALTVQLLKEAGIKEGDHVAVCMSGSFPVLNLATLAALDVLKTEPIVIFSVASSSWGANDPDFTFPDMITVLKKANYFKNLDIKYASMGGIEDMGMSLSKKGRQLIIEAIDRNKLILINKGSLQANIDERIKIIDEFSEGETVKAFINIGGGLGSLGSAKNGDAIPSGFNKTIKLKKIPDKTGVIYEMAKRGVPIINYSNLDKLIKTYHLPVNPVPLPDVGEGELFFIYKYDIKIVVITTIALITAILFFVYFDRKNHRLGNDIIADEIQI